MKYICFAGLLYRLHHGSNNNSIFEGVWRHFLIIYGYIWAVVVCVSRVYLEYHTSWQVVMGGMLGFVFACGWFAMVQLIFTPMFPVICSWYVACSCSSSVL